VCITLSIVLYSRICLNKEIERHNANIINLIITRTAETELVRCIWYMDLFLSSSNNVSDDENIEYIHLFFCVIA
jgi:hypothetical protein